MNYLIKLVFIILLTNGNIIKANEIINNKIIFKVNNQLYSNIDVEIRTKYVSLINNIKISELNSNDLSEILEDYIASIIYYEFFKRNNYKYDNLENDIDLFFKKKILINNSKLSKKEIEIYKKNIRVDLVRKKIIEDLLNSKKNQINTETDLLDVIYNYNLNYIIVKNSQIKESELLNIKNRKDFNKFNQQLKNNNASYFFKDEDIINSKLTTAKIQKMITKNDKIKIFKNKNFIEIYSLEKNLESYEGIFVKIISLITEIKLKKKQLNCKYINNLQEKISYNEYEYSLLNNEVKDNLKSVNDYMIINNENNFNYIFLCELKYDQKILENIDFNKKVKNLVNKIETNFLNKYKKRFNLIKIYE